MARPIKETPILTGKDAVNFYKEMTEAEKRYISDKEKRRIKQQADLLRSIETK